MERGGGVVKLLYLLATDGGGVSVPPSFMEIKISICSFISSVFHRGFFIGTVNYV
jgi:hypothetical protein